MGRVLTRSDSALTTMEREFELTDKDFKFIQWFIHKTVGIYLSDRKKTMVYGRVSRLLRKRGLQRFSDFKAIIESDEQERVHFINSLTTNKTEFFREYHHFEFIEKVMAKEWQERHCEEIRIWSAGCSTGQEPYSLVSSLYRSGVLDWCPSVRLIATDLDTNVLSVAQQGIYPDSVLESIPKPYLKPCFVKGKGAQQGNIKISKGLQQLIQFRQLNLLEQWNFNEKFDLISCRNVMIYFDKETQQHLLKRFHQQLNPNGILLIGHSESVGASSEIFHHLGHTIYVKR